jgi:hypothetical protein
MGFDAARMRYDIDARSLGGYGSSTFTPGGASM